jgi:hypothetical protein
MTDHRDPMSFNAFLQQLATASPKVAVVKPRHNPRPPGVIREGSASAAVLEFLRKSGRFHSEASIRFATGRSHSAVSWALLYLRGLGRIVAVPDTRRDARYLRYRAATTEEAAANKVATHGNERTRGGVGVGIGHAEEIATGAENEL